MFKNQKRGLWYSLAAVLVDLPLTVLVPGCQILLWVTSERADLYYTLVSPPSPPSPRSEYAWALYLALCCLSKNENPIYEMVYLLYGGSDIRLGYASPSDVTILKLQNKLA